MRNLVPLAVVAIVAYASGVFGPDKRAQALKKARAAKKRKAASRNRPARKRGGKMSKAALRAMRLRNLAKARRARKRKKA